MAIAHSQCFNCVSKLGARTVVNCSLHWIWLHYIRPNNYPISTRPSYERAGLKMSHWDFSIDNYETDFDRDRIERPFVKETACECENRPPSGRCRPRGKGKISGLPLVERQNKQIKILYFFPAEQMSYRLASIGTILKWRRFCWKILF